MLRNREVTPAQLIDVVAARVAATDHRINATPVLCIERAHRKARQLEWPDSPGAGYLYGLPILVKDTQAVEGVRFTEGASMFASRIAEHSDQLVAVLETQGAIVCGKLELSSVAAAALSLVGRQDQYSRVCSRKPHVQLGVWHHAKPPGSAGIGWGFLGGLCQCARCRASVAGNRIRLGGFAP